MAYTPPAKVGDKLGADGPRAKAYLRRFSYGAGLRGDDSAVYTEAFGLALHQFQNNVHSLVVTKRRPGPDVNTLGVFDWATKKQMGLLDTAPGQPPAPTPGVPSRSFYSFTGTWGAWDNGFGYDVGVRVDQRRYQHQGLGYNTNAFLMGNDPAHSYADMLNDGEAEFWRFGHADLRPKVLSGYSGGADCVSQVLRAWPAGRRGEILAVVQFGDPSRPPGKTLLGNDPGGHGISEDFPPDWVLDRYYSFTIEGDMYPNAVGLLPIFYDILTRVEATADFAMYLFQLFIDQLGNLTPIGGQLLGVGAGGGLPFFGQLSGLLPLISGAGGVLGGFAGPAGGLLPGGALGGLGGLLGGGIALPGGGATSSTGPVKVNLVAMVLNIPAIVQSLLAALKFLTTQAHSHYGDQPVFGGMTAVDKAVEIVNAL